MGTKYDAAEILNVMIVGSKRKTTETELSTNCLQINQLMHIDKNDFGHKIINASSQKSDLARKRESKAAKKKLISFSDETVSHLSPTKVEQGIGHLSTNIYDRDSQISLRVNSNSQTSQDLPDEDSTPAFSQAEKEIINDNCGLKMYSIFNRAECAIQTSKNKKGVSDHTNPKAIPSLETMKSDE